MTNLTALQVTDAEGSAHAVAPRVSLADIENAILERHDLVAGDIVASRDDEPGRPVLGSLGVLSICLVVFRNGFVVIGKSAPASAENYDREVGRKFAYEDAIRQAWPLFGFALRDRLLAEQEAFWRVRGVVR